MNCYQCGCRIRGKKKKPAASMGLSTGTRKLVSGSAYAPSARRNAGCSSNGLDSGPPPSIFIRRTDDEAQERRRRQAAESHEDL